MIAFVHIEKAAGTTLIHILRRNFFPRYMDVRPLARSGGKNLVAEDLRIARRINPKLAVIGGHAVTAFGNLEEACPLIQYITVLRSPEVRYVSQFKYWNRVLKKNISFEQFLYDESTWNIQTKKIAGTDDSQKAIEALHDNFMLTGVVEQFDEFLVLLRQKLAPAYFDPTYLVQNSANNSTSDSTPNLDPAFERFRSQIADRNASDQLVYDFVTTTLIPKQIEEYGPAFEPDLMKFRDLNRCSNKRPQRLYADFAVRKLYIEPVSGLIRMMNKLPYRGSYRK